MVRGHSLKPIASLLTLLILLSTVLPPYNTVHASSPTESSYEYVRSISLPVVAVSSTGEGVVSKLLVSVAYPGKGRVYFSADPLTMLDSQASARMAVLVASSILGIDYTEYDFFILINSSSLIIGGPSAGAAMTIGVIAALTNSSVRDDVAITGMINPDGTIGPVGGIPAKLRAVAKAGYKVFLIPAGQSITYDETIVQENTPLGVVTRITRVPVNVTELGAKLGVKVIEVGDIVTAASIFTDKNLTAKKTVLREPSYSMQQETLLKNWVEKLERSKAEILGKITAENLPENVLNLINESNRLHKIAEELKSKGELYSAASYEFRAAVFAETAYVITSLKEERAIKRYVDEVNKTINIAERALREINVTTLSGLESYIAAKNRVEDAKEALEKAVNSIVLYKDLVTGRKRIVIEDPESLAYAKLRALSALLWIEYSNITSPAISWGELIRAAKDLLYYSETVLSYYNSLSSQNPSNSIVQEYYKARTEYSRGDYPSAIAHCIDVLSEATLNLHIMFNTNLGKTLKALEKKALENLALTSNYTSAIALGYYELAKEEAKRYYSTGDENSACSALRLFVMSSTISFLLHRLTTQVKQVSGINNKTGVIAITSTPKAHATNTTKITATAEENKTVEKTTHPPQELVNVKVVILTLVLVAIMITTIALVRIRNPFVPA